MGPVECATVRNNDKGVTGRCAPMHPIQWVSGNTGITQALLLPLEQPPLDRINLSHLCSPVPCNSKVLRKHLKDCSTDWCKRVSWLRLEYDNLEVKQHSPGGLLCALGRKNHSNCHKMFRDSVTGVAQHPVISLGPGRAVGNNRNLCFIRNSELHRHLRGTTEWGRGVEEGGRRENGSLWKE